MTKAVVGDLTSMANLTSRWQTMAPLSRLGSVSILLGNGDGTFQARSDYPAGVNPVSVVLGDFDADGDLDLAVGDNNYPQGEAVLLGSGDGTFRHPLLYQLPDGPHGNAVGDFNADGKA